MHSNPSSSCKSCNDKLLECHNSLYLWFEILSDNFKDLHISIGFRGEKEQNEAYAEGLTHAPWPKSKHNRMNGQNPESWAIDVFRLGDDGNAHFEESYFRNIWNFINNIQTQARDIELHWGGNFMTLKDYDHIELIKAEVHQYIEVLSQDHC